MTTLRRVLRQNLPAAVKRSVLASGVCTYCGDLGTVVDHDIPLARGGTDDRDNLVPACPPCNDKKGTMTGAEFFAFRAEAIRFRLDPAVLEAILGEGCSHGTELSAYIDDLVNAIRIIQSCRSNAIGAAIVTGLRQEGMTYREIEAATGIAKGTMHGWLRKQLEGSAQEGGIDE